MRSFSTSFFIFPSSRTFQALVKTRIGVVNEKVATLPLPDQFSTIRSNHSSGIFSDIPQIVTLQDEDEQVKFKGISRQLSLDKYKTRNGSSFCPGIVWRLVKTIGDHYRN
jgi:hypothetical protein